jgi:hypothetical protein
MIQRIIVRVGYADLREQFAVSRDWFIIKVEVAYKRMLKCTKYVELRNIGEY